MDNDDFVTQYVTNIDPPDDAPRRPISPVLWVLLAMLLIGLAIAVIV